MSDLHPKTRNANIEVFRCFLMFLIVLYHSWNHGLFGPDAGMQNLNVWWRVFFDAFLIWHIDGFIVISGWYGIRFSWKKFFSLYGTIAYYSVLSMALWFVFDRPSFSVKSINITGGWFGSSYLMLMLCAPLINAAVDKLSETGRKALFSAWGLLAIGMTCAWLPHHGFTAINPAGGGSHSFTCMVFVYVTALVARRVIDYPLPKAQVLKCMAIYPLAVLVLGGGGALLYNLSRTHAVNWAALNAMSEYQAPHVWGFAMLVFLLFLWHVHIPAWLGRCCAIVGPSTFAIYLLHDVMFGGALTYIVPQKFMNQFSVSPVLSIVVSACVAFFACFLLDMPRRLLVLLLKKTLTKKVPHKEIKE